MATQIQLQLHVEVTLLPPAKKKKRPASWAVLEGKLVRGEGRAFHDPKGLLAQSAGRLFASALYSAHDKRVKLSDISVAIADHTTPEKAAAAKDAAKAAKDAAKAEKADQPAKAEKVSEKTGAKADKPAKKAKLSKKAEETVAEAIADEPTIEEMTADKAEETAVPKAKKPARAKKLADTVAEA